jgi:hypothetical protein
LANLSSEGKILEQSEPFCSSQSVNGQLTPKKEELFWRQKTSPATTDLAKMPKAHATAKSKLGA